MSDEKYIVTMTVDGYIEVEVIAKDTEDAKKKAYEKFSEMDFGSLLSAEASVNEISLNRKNI